MILQFKNYPQPNCSFTSYVYGVNMGKQKRRNRIYVLDLLTNKNFREKLYHVWLCPIGCGIFSFFYWFVFVPQLLPYIIHFKSDPSVSTYYIVAFCVWLLIIAMCLFWWWYKYKKSNKDEVKADFKVSSNTADIGSCKLDFPTEIAPVQPATELPPYDSVCDGFNQRPISISMHSILVQPNENIPQRDGINVARRNSFIEVHKEFDPSSSQNKSMSLHENKTDQFPVDEICLSDFSSNRDETNKTSPDNSFSSKIESQAVVGNESHGELTRDDSFKGLPELNSFGEYLQLVTIDTPMSPRELFFKDLIAVDKGNQSQTVNKTRFSTGDYFTKIHSQDYRKSMPENLFSPFRPFSFSQGDESSDETFNDHQTKVSNPQVNTINQEPEGDLERITYNMTEDGSDHNTQLDHVNNSGNFESTVENFSHSPPKNKECGTSITSDTSAGEYFIANVLRTESLTSEVYLNIDTENKYNSQPQNISMKYQYKGGTNDNLHETDIDSACMKSYPLQTIDSSGSEESVFTDH